MTRQLAEQDKRIVQLEAEIQGIDRVLATLDDQITSYDQEIEERGALYEDELANKEKLRRARRRKLELDSERAGWRSERSQLKAQLAAVRTKRELAQRQYNKEVGSRLAEVRG